MLASFPASMLNQKPSDLGILNRFKLDPSRSSAPLCKRFAFVTGNDGGSHPGNSMLTKTPHLFDDATQVTAGDSRWQGKTSPDYGRLSARSAAARPPPSCGR